MEEHLALIHRTVVPLESFGGDRLYVVARKTRVLRQPFLGNLEQLDYRNDLFRICLIHLCQTLRESVRPDHVAPGLALGPGYPIAVADLERREKLELSAVGKPHLDRHGTDFNIRGRQPTPN